MCKIEVESQDESTRNFENKIENEWIIVYGF